MKTLSHLIAGMTMSIIAIMPLSAQVLPSIGNVKSAGNDYGSIFYPGNCRPAGLTVANMTRNGTLATGYGNRSLTALGMSTTGTD